MAWKCAGMFMGSVLLGAVPTLIHSYMALTGNLIFTLELLVIDLLLIAFSITAGSFVSTLKLAVFGSFTGWDIFWLWFFVFAFMSGISLIGVGYADLLSGNYILTRNYILSLSCFSILPITAFFIEIRYASRTY